VYLAWSGIVISRFYSVVCTNWVQNLWYNNVATKIQKLLCSSFFCTSSFWQWTCSFWAQFKKKIKWHVKKKVRFVYLNSRPNLKLSFTNMFLSQYLFLCHMHSMNDRLRSLVIPTLFVFKLLQFKLNLSHLSYGYHMENLAFQKYFSVWIYFPHVVALFRSQWTQETLAINLCVQISAYDISLHSGVCIAAYATSNEI
jgi:hypothetical protein